MLLSYIPIVLIFMEILFVLVSFRTASRIAFVKSWVCCGVYHAKTYQWWDDRWFLILYSRILDILTFISFDMHVILTMKNSYEHVLLSCEKIYVGTRRNLQFCLHSQTLKKKKLFYSVFFCHPNWCQSHNLLPSFSHCRTLDIPIIWPWVSSSFSNTQCWLQKDLNIACISAESCPAAMLPFKLFRCK